MDVAAMMEEVDRDIEIAAVMAMKNRRVPFSMSDFVQELRLRVLQAVDRWDSSKSAWRTYIRNRLRFLAVDVLRDAGYVKRDKRPQVDRPLSEVCDEVTRIERADQVDDLADVDWQDWLDWAGRQGREVQMAVLWTQGRYTMAQLGEMFGVSESRVSQMLSKKNDALWVRLRAIGESLT